MLKYGIYRSFWQNTLVNGDTNVINAYYNMLQNAIHTTNNTLLLVLLLDKFSISEKEVLWYYYSYILLGIKDGNTAIETQIIQNGSRRISRMRWVCLKRFTTDYTLMYGWKFVPAENTSTLVVIYLKLSQTNIPEWLEGLE